MYSDSLLHNGAAENLAKVLDNPTHMNAGGGLDVLDDEGKRAQLLRFLQSIDASTPPIDPSAGSQ